ncbi:hypothetical protein ACFSTE_20440 [Aquimarina hainanensis]|uniref:DUF4848 domain-containing protein n=1 Tax=Aquimarina hainanensis TaxID=1578017 RepID=A0ABW5NFN4_9FLAO|nr:hypothetical protein [Aquimarina sp. TRL1]QKX06314.1 hypothetical protein HN014_15810 [Aquimarina sp. TRL1]
MNNTHITLLLVLLSFTTLLSCTKEALPAEEVNITEEESITLYLADVDETITVKSLDEVKVIIAKRYDQNNKAVKNAIGKINLFQKEMKYASTLDLTDPDVEKKYSQQIQQKYSNHKVYNKSTNGILWDGHATGFLSVTTIPLNLKASKRNKASSWSPISPGTVVLCDKKWFKGSKFVLFSIIPGPTAVVHTPFDNKADSFF